MSVARRFGLAISFLHQATIHYSTQPHPRACGGSTLVTFALGRSSSYSGNTGTPARTDRRC